MHVLSLALTLTVIECFYNRMKNDTSLHNDTSEYDNSMYDSHLDVQADRSFMGKSRTTHPA